MYDATRWTGVPRPVMEKILVALKNAFGGCRTILDVGIGTGRFAENLAENGLAVVGIDVSLPMMMQAKEKGVGDLVRADAHHLPFRDLSFDGSLMIHVLHLVQDWAEVVREVGRVTRSLVVSEAGDTEGFNPRQKYLELRKELGHPLVRLNDGELGLRRIIPPKYVVPTGDYWTETNAKEEIESFEARRSSVMWDVPENVHRRIMERLHKEYDGRNLRRHDIPEVVSWDPAQFRSLISNTGQR